MDEVTQFKSHGKVEQGLLPPRETFLFTACCIKNKMLYFKTNLGRKTVQQTDRRTTDGQCAKQVYTICFPSVSFVIYFNTCTPSLSQSIKSVYLKDLFIAACDQKSLKSPPQKAVSILFLFVGCFFTRLIAYKIIKEL